MSEPRQKSASNLAYIEVRTFRFPQDYLPVYALWEQAGPGLHTGRSDTQPEIAKKLERDADLFLVAEVQGTIVGTVLGGFDGRRGIVYHLAVDQDYRRQGLGKTLMRILEDRLRAKGCLRYYLLVTLENERAMRFYEELGWERMNLCIYAKDI